MLTHDRVQWYYQIEQNISLRNTILAGRISNQSSYFCMVLNKIVWDERKQADVLIS